MYLMLMGIIFMFSFEWIKRMELIGYVIFLFLGCILYKEGFKYSNYGKFFFGFGF